MMKLRVKDEFHEDWGPFPEVVLNDLSEIPAYDEDLPECRNTEPLKPGDFFFADAVFGRLLLDGYPHFELVADVPRGES